MILLSAAGHSAVQIAALTVFDQDSVLFWLDRYEAEGLGGLEDRALTTFLPHLETPSG